MVEAGMISSSEGDDELPGILIHPVDWNTVSLRALICYWSVDDITGF